MARIVYCCTYRQYPLHFVIPEYLRRHQRKLNIICCTMCRFGEAVNARLACGCIDHLNGVNGPAHNQRVYVQFRGCRGSVAKVPADFFGGGAGQSR